MRNSPFVGSETWLSPDSCTLAALIEKVAAVTTRADYPLAADIQRNVPIYDCDVVRANIDNPDAIRGFMGEWNSVLLDGPGALVGKRTYADTTVIDAATEVLTQIIEQERRSKVAPGDHFAKSGANARVWNAHEKLCVADPKTFARYNSNSIVALIARSWLGPCYQVTAQVNVIYPGGDAQTPHRDYHMGLQPICELEQYPSHLHRLSPALTLQGAIAHCNVPVQSGPTKLLPFSQRFVPGYFAPYKSEFVEYFESHYVQLPLDKGDSLFFNPALLHAGGRNSTTDIARFVNLLQIGSAYGRSTEAVDRIRMSKALFPVLKEMMQKAELDSREVETVIAACAEGYPFPVNLDLEPPNYTNTHPPRSQQNILHQAIREAWSPERFVDALEQYAARRRSH